MANQKAILDLAPADGGSGRRSLRVILVDTDGGAATFTDYGAGTTFVADRDYVFTGIQGQGTTAPATATAFQIRVDGSDRQLFINGAAVFDPKSTMHDRMGALLGKVIGKGSTLAITGRA